MTRDEFLADLRKNLRGLPNEEIEDRLNFYDEMIRDRMDEGKTEEEAVADIGTTDTAVREIASQTKISTLVKEKIKAKRQINGWEIALIILGFPLWFPLLITALVLLLVAYMMVWIVAIVAYSIETGFIGGFVVGVINFVGSIIDGNPSLLVIGASLLCLAGACFFVFACIYATKFNYGISKRIIVSIKSKFIKGGKNNE